MKRGIILLILLIFIIVPALALNIDISSQRIDKTIIPGQEALYILKIKNLQSQEDIFRIYPDDFSMAPFSDTISSIKITPSHIAIPANTEKTVEVSIRTFETAKPNKNYVAFIEIHSLKQNLKIKHPLSVYIIPSEQLINIETDLPEEITPSEEYVYSVNLENTGNSNLENLQLSISSPFYSEQEIITLLANEKIKKEFTLEIDPSITIGDYILNIRLYKNRMLIGNKLVNFKVSENPGLKEVNTIEKGFLTTTIKITKQNQGNTLISKKVKYPITTFQKIFTKTSPEAEIVKENGQKYYIWNLDIAAGTQKQITIKTDYKLLFALIIFILFIFILIVYKKTKNILISKTVFKVKDDKEKSMTELKVLINVKNRTPNEIHNLRVMDLLPNFVKLTDDFVTLKPTNIQQGSKGMRLIWHVPLLEPGEERIITYRIKSKLHVLGRLSFPAAAVQYRVRGKRIINIKSNKVIFFNKKL